MFLIFISDIGQDSKAMSHIYVDDSKVAMNVTNENHIEEFQEELDRFYYWTDSNKSYP